MKIGKKNIKNIKMIKSEFYIYHNKFQDFSDKALDWFIRSWKYAYNSDEWKVCRLKQSILKRKAMEYLDKAGKELNG